jgi:hypothetical protein
MQHSHSMYTITFFLYDFDPMRIACDVVGYVTCVYVTPASASPSTTERATMSVSFIYTCKRRDLTPDFRDDDDEYLYGESLRDDKPTTSGMQLDSAKSTLDVGGHHILCCFFSIR